jgi:NADPH:quinone reductase-like Zn-dependent oxidoreductase
MRAVLIKDEKGPVENLYIGEASTPKPKATEVLVKVCAEPPQRQHDEF